MSSSFHHDQPHGFLLGEIAFDVNYSCGEKPSFPEQGSVCADIDVQGTVGGQAMQKPEVPVVYWIGRWQESRVQWRLFLQLEGGHRLG